MTGRFRKKPVEVDAYMYAGRIGATFPAWLEAAIDAGDVYFFRHEMVIRTREGSMIAVAGDWVVRGITGELYPVRGDIFDANYEAAP
jgi:hypothetical protein